MADGSNQERDGDASSSDDDSISLLRNLNRCLSKAEDMEVCDLNLQVGSKKQEQEMEVNQLKPPESGISSCAQSAAGCANSTSQLANVSRPLKNPNRARHKKRNEKGETPLHGACQRKDVERVKVLIQAGIDPNMPDYAGWTALHEAAAVGGEAVVRELLRAGANVNARSFDGVTPLHDAVTTGDYQVVKLLLQHGSDVRDRTVGGLAALDMTEQENIKELLLAFTSSSGTQEEPREAAAHHRPAGEASSEAPCSSSSFSHSYNDMAKVQPRESGDGDGAREPGDIQLRKKDNAADNARHMIFWRLAASPSESFTSHSKAVTVALEAAGRKQAEISTWTLIGPQDAGRYQAALTHIQSVLIEALALQQSEKDNLARKCRSVSGFLRQLVLKSQLRRLASLQRTLVEVLQRQTRLVEVFVTMKTKLSAFHLPDRSAASTQASSKAAKVHSCNQDSHGEESQRALTQTSLLSSASPHNAKEVKLPRPPPPASRTRGRKTTTHVNKKANSCQSGTPRPRHTPQHLHSEPCRGLRAEDDSRPLSQLTRRGVVPCGSTLQLLLKSCRHLAHVLGDGSIKDGKGKRHRAPERWLESIFGNNIPVSSAYAWDKVTFKDKPLSYYLLNVESEGDAPQTCPRERRRARSSQEELLTEGAILKRLMTIQKIHLVDDEELLPTALLDGYWEKLLKQDCSECDHGWNEL